jgi:hypothetical protein
MNVCAEVGLGFLHQLDCHVDRDTGVFVLFSPELALSSEEQVAAYSVTAHTVEFLETLGLLLNKVESFLKVVTLLCC